MNFLKKGWYPMTSMKSRKSIIQHKADTELSGLGTDVVKILDADNGTCICFIGIQNDAEMVHFTKPVSLESIEAIVELLHKKKFGKALNDGDIEKAQKYADKKFAI